MNNFNDFFDVKNLDENQIGHMMFVLNSPSYVDVFEPYLLGVRNTMNNLILDPSITREEKYPDKFLIGGINAIDGLLNLFNKLINETEMERIARSQQVTNEQQYEIFRQEGKIKPASGLVRTESEPYDPSEDY